MMVLPGGACEENVKMTTNGHKIHEFDGCKVNVTLSSMRTTPDVFWSPRWEGCNGKGSMGGCNSYVLALVQNKVCLFSVNGCGEVRWEVTRHDIGMFLANEGESWWRQGLEGYEQLQAARHFGIAPSPDEVTDPAKRAEAVKRFRGW